MTKHPKLSFIIDIEKEKENAKNFFDHKEDVWLRERFFRGDAEYLLTFGSTDAERDQERDRYITETYAIHTEDMERSLARARMKWGEIEEAYFAVIDSLFRGRPWPEGDYRAEISIFGMFPRWVGEKLFFIPFEHPELRHAHLVIAHEMLHFMFFDYIRERYGLREGTKLKGREEDYIWKVSEVFNVVIEHWGPYMKAIPGCGTSEPYPGQEKMFEEMSAQWNERQEVPWLLDQWLKE